MEQMKIKWNPEAIKAARVDAGLSQVELAEKIGKYQPIVSSWERGAMMPSIESAALMASAFGIDLGVFASRLYS